jgi:hypothetical protein
VQPPSTAVAITSAQPSRAVPDPIGHRRRLLTITVIVSSPGLTGAQARGQVQLRTLFSRNLAPSACEIPTIGVDLFHGFNAGI